jgi:hypothetical protein
VETVITIVMPAWLLIVFGTLFVITLLWVGTGSVMERRRTRRRPRFDYHLTIPLGEIRGEGLTLDELKQVREEWKP